MVEPDDRLSLKNNSSITCKIGDEQINFSYKVQKYSRGSISIFARNQDRIIMITNKAVYNLDGTEIKRRIKLEDIYGITVSTLSNQFIIHGKSNEYDYLYISPDKKKIIKALQSSYKAKEGNDLLFCKKAERDIFKYVISKKETTKNPYIKRINEEELSSINDYIGSYDTSESGGGGNNFSYGSSVPKANIPMNAGSDKNNINENKPEEKDELVKSLNKRIEELENEIKYFRTYYKLSDNEKLISIKFISVEQNINLTVIAKNTDYFSFIEKILYDHYPNYKQFENYFLVNGSKINKNITLEENKIKNNDILTVVINDFD